MGWIYLRSRSFRLLATIITSKDITLTHMSGTGEPFFLKLAVLSLASSSQLFLCLVVVVVVVVVIVESLLNAGIGGGYELVAGGRPYSYAGFVMVYWEVSYCDASGRGARYDGRC